MRNLKIAVFVLFATAAVSAQDLTMDQIPANINANFQQSYPMATEVEWEKDGQHYKVEFDIHKMEKEIWYLKTGDILKTEREITKNELPDAVLATAQNLHPEYKIDEVELTEENGKKIYEVELDKWFSDDIKLLIAEDGSLLTNNK